MEKAIEQKIKDVISAYLPASLSPDQYQKLIAGLCDIYDVKASNADKPYKEHVVGLTIKDLQNHLALIQDFIKTLESFGYISESKDRALVDQKLLELRQKDFEISEMLYSNRWW